LSLTFERDDRRKPLQSKSPPLVSCIMPTRDRREYVLQSIRYFERQDYANRELIIIDDGIDDLSNAIPSIDRIRYVRIQRGISIGAKRNRGCQLAAGSIIAQWDDDDWYSPGRLSAQAQPIITGQADITGLKERVLFELRHWRFWLTSPELHRRMFVGDVHGGTLVYGRTCWERLARYPDCSLAEDASFLWHVIRRGARLKGIADTGLSLYLRHERNSWQFECGRFMDPKGWVQINEPSFFDQDRGFYATLSSAVPQISQEYPLVTCIMPTADRRGFVPDAIRYFTRQTYPNRELLILDDGQDSIADLVPACEQIRYVRLERRLSIGAKRNLACELARGEIIAHWDDDDWIADWRLSYQVKALVRHSSPAVCGVSRLLFLDSQHGRAWTYSRPVGERRPWIAGGTLCYHKTLWRRFPFPNISQGEDTRFIWSIPPESVLNLTDNDFYVATVHARNTSPKYTTDMCWRPFSSLQMRELIGTDWPLYEAAARTHIPTA
jgi:glycosyltransferase involved in cell wall biosynthesis